jgi:FkbM family methyltransferase
MARPRYVLDALAQQLFAHPRVADALTDTTDAIGARGATDKINRLRSRHEVATVRMPSQGSERRASLSMLTSGNRDQCATGIGRGGWLAFERPMPDVFLAECRHATGHVLDVGANTGIYSLLAVLGNPALRAAAFEPVPYIAEILRANIDLNKVSSRVSVEPVAVGSQTGTALLYLPLLESAGVINTSGTLSADFNASNATSFEVSVVPLDAWWTKNDRPKVSILKVDVESRELDVLLGAQDLIANEQPIVFCELLPKGDPAGLATWAAERDFVDIRLQPERAVVGEVPSFDPAAWNHMLVPRAALRGVTDRLTRLGLFGATEGE